MRRETCGRRTHRADRMAGALRSRIAERAHRRWRVFAFRRWGRRYGACDRRDRARVRVVAGVIKRGGANRVGNCRHFRTIRAIGCSFRATCRHDFAIVPGFPPAWRLSSETYAILPAPFARRARCCTTASVRLPRRSAICGARCARPPHPPTQACITAPHYTERA